MYGLVDCNNFYASCERVFRPHLEHKPVVVLSNNDGCAISRSEEAKALGIEMGAPEFELRDLVRQHGLSIFSSNYTLYGDMSARVMHTLSQFVPRLEIYSIDEAFLDLFDLSYHNLLELGLKIRHTVRQHTGIPVSVGIAATKTLSKMANRYAKKRHRDIGVYYAVTPALVQEMLEFTLVGDIWGVGLQYAKMLKANGIETAAQLAHAPDDFIRDKMTVVGHRLLNELRGVPSIEWALDPVPKKNICTSKSFGQLQDRKEVIVEAAANYASTCAEKLRRQHSCARSICVFLQTNPHRTQDKQYARSIKVDLPIATSSTPELIRYVLKGLNIIFRPGYKFKKVGVMVLDLVPYTQVQLGLFDKPASGEDKKVNATMDKINLVFGKDTVRYAVQGFERRYRLRAEHKSPRYTTDIHEVLKVRI